MDLEMEYICSDCGVQQEESTEMICVTCRSQKLLLIKAAKALFGKSWKTRFIK